MDSQRTVESKSSPSVVLHRIRRHSHTVTGAPIAGIISDGIGSPTDTAHLPPGVLTKIDTLHTRKLSAAQVKTSSTGQPRRMICKNCNKKCNCICKRCSLDQVKLYARREYIRKGNEKNARIQAEVLELVKPTEAVKVQICSKEDKVIALRVAVENAKLRIGLKQKEVNHLDSTKPTTAAQFATVFASHKKHKLKCEERKKELKAKLEATEAEVAKVRYQYCIAACRFFPVQIMDANVESVPQKAKSSKNWAVVNDSELQQGLGIAIRNSYMNPKLLAKLSSHLSNGSISLPPELHPCFAAFTNTLQLVHLLSVIFNFRPPESLSHHDLCIRDCWTKESMDRDWSTLCTAVVYLCVFIGMKPSDLKYADLHYNLIALSSYVFSNQDKIQKIGSRPMCDLAEVHAIIASQRPEESQKKDEVDESWIFVD